MGSLASGAGSATRSLWGWVSRGCASRSSGSFWGTGCTLGYYIGASEWLASGQARRVPGRGAGVDCYRLRIGGIGCFRGVSEPSQVRPVPPVIAGVSKSHLGYARSAAKPGRCRELCRGWAGVWSSVFPVSTGVLAFFRELGKMRGSGMVKLDLSMRPASQVGIGLAVGLFVVAFLAAIHRAGSLAQ